MTAVLEKAVSKAAFLPVDQQDVLAALATEAMEEHRAGETEDLDPDTLGRA